MFNDATMPQDRKLQGMDTVQISRLRKIKESTAMGYIAIAIWHGHRYQWPLVGLEPAKIEFVIKEMEELQMKNGIPLPLSFLLHGEILPCKIDCGIIWALWLKTFWSGVHTRCWLGPYEMLTRFLHDGHVLYDLSFDSMCWHSTLCLKSCIIDCDLQFM